MSLCSGRSCLHCSQLSRGFMVASSAASLWKGQLFPEGVRSRLPCPGPASCPSSSAGPPNEKFHLCLEMQTLFTEGCVCVVFPSRLYQVTKPPATIDKRKRRAALPCWTSLLGNMTGARRPVWPPTGANQRGFIWPTCSTGAPGRWQQNPTVVLSCFRPSRWVMSLTSVRSL